MRSVRAARIATGALVPLLVLLWLGSFDAGAATKRKYCTRHSHPKGCIQVPKAAKRPPKVNQQGSDAITPPDVVNGGGLGGGPGVHRKTALAWARTQRGLDQWAWRCERFVEEAYGTRQQFDTAIAAARSLPLHRESIAKAPAGSLVYFRADKHNRGYGHVGISLGGGKMISALDKVATTDVARSPYWKRLYLGWVDAPDAWPGRIPPAPGPTTPDPELTVRLTAPAVGQTVSGTVELIASARGAGGVAFDAYYATDPLDASTRGWHSLGMASKRDGTWVLTWDTASIPNQGLPAWGTVNVVAIALDAAGGRTGTRDYRRLAIDNGTATHVIPVPIPTPDPVRFKYHVHNTCRDNSCGLVVETGGPGSRFGGVVVATIPDGTEVSIRCQVVGGLVTGGVGSNEVWDQIDWEGGVAYVPDLYIDTPGDLHAQSNRYFTSTIPRC